MFYVVGGHHRTIIHLDVEDGTEETYGPFDTYEEAYAVWKQQTWLKVDDALHRLFICSHNQYLGFCEDLISP